MEANRYFEEMQKAVSAQRAGWELLAQVRVQDPGGADAYLELRRCPSDNGLRVIYSTMGRQSLNFQLFRKGWLQCHNAAGELVGRFPATAEGLLGATDFTAYLRDDAVEPRRAARILRELSRLAGTNYAPALPTRAGAIITVDSFVGRGAHWCYAASSADSCMTIAAVLVWLGDVLAGAERRTLQSCAGAVQLAAAWQAELDSPFARPADAVPRPAVRRRAAASSAAGTNERWQSILAVLATV